MLRECEGDGNDVVEDGGGVVAVSAGHEYVGGTRGSGIVSNATGRARDECGAWDEMSWWSVCVWLGAVCDKRIRFGLYQSCGNRGNV